ncbi:LOW QUALITY PROTEIN: hypothetical protein BRADI_4g44634v3 [Brachypodium distachyon]|uniref:Biogenesis of lysosome-related organelles complex 1 subunit 1 n=1 Tax=Brachypodium distachyon TaxID=15368 RepID=A0A2K2CU70_BRADI|nr:LOW QUALITY PROTEIN: hypothetical protein BRADI_4g44634v3 [Brachypodium distachyon]
MERAKLASPEQPAGGQLESALLDISAADLVDAMDGGVQELFKRVEVETRALLAAVARRRKQTDPWLAAINSVLKEIGDFENWMKVM